MKASSLNNLFDMKVWVLNITIENVWLKIVTQYENFLEKWRLQMCLYFYYIDHVIKIKSK